MAYGPLQPQQCFHCNKTITKRNDLFDAFTGEYFSNVKGKWLCRKCYERQDAAETKAFRKGLELTGHKPKLVPILIVRIYTGLGVAAERDDALPPKRPPAPSIRHRPGHNDSKSKLNAV